MTLEQRALIERLIASRERLYLSEGERDALSAALRATPEGTPQTAAPAHLLPDAEYANIALVALRACEDALRKHDLWCGHRRGSPGDPSFNRAERLIRKGVRALEAYPAALSAAPPAPAPVSREQVALHEQYVVDHAADHDDDCPCDDTCECSMKPRNDAVNAICHYLTALSAAPPAPTQTMPRLEIGDVVFHSASRDVIDADFPIETWRQNFAHRAIHEIQRNGVVIWPVAAAPAPQPEHICTVCKKDLADGDWYSVCGPCWWNRVEVYLAEAAPPAPTGTPTHEDQAHETTTRMVATEPLRDVRAVSVHGELRASEDGLGQPADGVRDEVQGVAPTGAPADLVALVREWQAVKNTLIALNNDGGGPDVDAFGAECDRYDAAEVAMLAWHPAAPALPPDEKGAR